MITLLGGFFAAFLVWSFLKALSGADPKKLARLSTMGGGVAAFAVAAVLMVRGRMDMAMLAAGAGAWLFGWGASPLTQLKARFGIPERTSRMRSAMVDMTMDHGTGRLQGQILVGPQAGRRLDELDFATLDALRRAGSVRDPDGSRLLEAYLDRRFPGWREHAEAHADPGPRRDPQGGAMAQEEAYQVLGLQPGADADTIRRAHRALMKKLHPDQGGSTYLASRVNQAKDVLLNRHR